ncbi:hypothetical protein PSTT_11522, partial [Puccinia striiformis]
MTRMFGQQAARLGILPLAPSRSRAASKGLLLPLIFIFILSTLILPLNALKDPSSTLTKFMHMPSKLIYFEDTPIILSHDSILREVWRSTDEGKSWNLISTVPTGDAWLVVEHTWDNRVAFILSRGSKHWRSINRGDSWQSFTTSDQPSISGSPLAFHSTRWNWILFSGQKCESLGTWKGKLCYDETWITSDAFETQPKMMIQHSTKCMWAYSNKHFSSSVAEEMIYCITKEAPSDQLKALAGQLVNDRESRLYSSKDFFVKDRQYVDLGLGKNGRGVVGMGAVQKYIVVALKPGNIFSEAINGQSSSDEMLLFVTSDGMNWARANFPHGHGLKENAYTIVESTPHSIMVDVLTHPTAGAGTLFTSDSNGTHFIKSLENTSRSTSGIVDFEKIMAIEGISIANTVLNVDEVKGSKEHKKVQSKITFDDGGHWSLLKAPSVDAHGNKFHCDVSDIQSCALHLHSVTQPHNFGRVFSTPSPGILMGVGNVGEHLLSYGESDTFLSIDGGLNWKMVKEGARKYEIGDQGGLIVMLDDEETTDEVDYSFDFGKTWSTYNFKQKLRVKLLTSVPDSTSQKFLLLGTIPKKNLPSSSKSDRQAVLQLDFSQMDRKKCQASDFENCNISNGENLMPLAMSEKNSKNQRVMKRIVRVPTKTLNGQCANPNDKFLGSSGYRLIPGNTCNRATGLKKDEPALKDCNEGKAAPGQVTHQRFQFPGLVLEQVYFEDSHTVLVFTSENQVWQSKNQGYSWDEPVKNVKFILMQIHPYSRDRAYLIAPDQTIYYSTDKGSSWNHLRTPLEANLLGIPLIDFHPTRPDWLIWTGSEGCVEAKGEHCKAVAYYSKDNGRYWNKIDDYVRICSWARDKKFKADERLIFCQAYQHKRGSQKSMSDNPLQLIQGRNFFDEKKKLFDSIVGFATFEEFMVVAQIAPNGEHLNLYASMDGSHFALAQFPPNLKIENKAYTVLESTTDAVFLHVTTNGQAGSEYGSLFKSNSNDDGTRWNSHNPDEARITRQKKLSLESHTMMGSLEADRPTLQGLSWSAIYLLLNSCALHIHGYTERADPRATYSSPSAVGLMMAVGNVVIVLRPTRNLILFDSRRWFHMEEVSKDAHMWEYGDQVNDEGPTDRVKYTLMKVSHERIRFRRNSYQMPDDTSRKFILFGFTKRTGDITVVIHLDFSKITNVKCVLDTTDPNHDDFELWSPSETRTEPCLFGRQTLYYRRVRSPSRLCYVGEKLPQPHKIQEIVYVPRKILSVNLITDEIRGRVQKIPYSSCEGGVQLEKGRQHICPNASGHGVFWWGTVVVAPAILFGLGGFWWMRRRASGEGGGWRRGVIHLPDGGRRAGGGSGVSETLDTIASIPWFLVGVGSALWGGWVGGGRQGYRQVSLDDDAELLQDYED